jgi:hypothetical protein
MADTPLGWYRWFPRDFLASSTVRKMSYTSQGVYRALLDLQWEIGVALTYPEAILILRLSEFEKSEFEPFFDACFPDGFNAKLMEQRAMQVKAIRAQREAGKVGGKTAGKGRPKSDKGRVRGISNQTETETETETDVLDKSNTVLMETWSAFVEHRKSIKAKMTPQAAKLILKKLQPFNDTRKIALLEEAIERGWKSVFPQEEKKGNSPMDQSRRALENLARKEAEGTSQGGFF